MKDKNLKIGAGILVLYFLYKKFFGNNTTPTTDTTTNTIQPIVNQSSIIFNSAKFDKYKETFWYYEKDTYITIDAPILNISITTTKDIALTPEQIKLLKNYKSMTCDLFWTSSPNVGWYGMDINAEPTDILKKGNYILSQKYGTDPNKDCINGYNDDKINGTITIGKEQLYLYDIPVRIPHICFPII
jgi:hypothetical protein